MKDYYSMTPPPTRFGHSMAWWSDGFSFGELEKIVKLCDDIPRVDGIIGGNVNNDTPLLASIRRSKIAWVPVNDETKWLYDKLMEITSKVNAEFFGFDISGLFQLQYTTYRAEEEGFYDWHVDQMGPGHVQRKLSFSLQLSDPLEYEGGELWLRNHSSGAMNKTRGMMHFFPSYVLHRVTPVTKGERKSLVGWVVGPEFR